VFLLIRLAWRNLWRQRRRTLITANAMAIGLAFSLTLLSLMDGVYGLMFEMVVTGTMGHAQIHDPDYPQQKVMWETIGDAGALVDELQGRPEVAQVAPRLYGSALLGFGEYAEGGQLFGIAPQRETAITGLAGKVAEGRFLEDGAPKEILLGQDLAAGLGAGLGDEVLAVSQAADGSTANDLYTVVGLMETGSVLLDRTGVWMGLADLQAFFAQEGQVHEIVLIAPSIESFDAMVDGCSAATDARGLQLRSWREVNYQMAQMMDMSDAFNAMFLMFILGAAALGVLNTMLMAVFERTRELGVIRALGMGPAQMVLLVLWETFALTLVACAIGLPVGLAGVAYLVYHGLDLTGVMAGFSMMGMNFNTYWMGEFHLGKVLATVAGLFFISFGAALWPALRAARLRPVDAMRQE